MQSYDELLRDNRELQARLDEAEETLRAIRSGEVDAMVVSTAQGNQIFTLQSADHPYRILIEEMHEGAVTLQADGFILYSNRCFADILSYPLETLLSQSIYEYFAAEDRQRLSEFLRRAQAQESIPCEFVLQSQQGEPIPVRIEAHPIPFSQSLILGLVVRDLRERKRAESALAWLAAVVTSSNDAIISETLDGTITTWNQGAERLFGYSAVEVIQKSIALLIPYDIRDEETLFLQKVTAGETVQNFETIRVKKDGSRIFVSVSLSLVKNDQGNIIGVSKIVQDISERKQSEQAQRKSQALLAQMGRVAHLGAWELNVETRELVWTEEVYRIHEVDAGYHPAVSEAISFYAPTSRPIIERAVQRVFDLGEPYDLELEFITAKGNHRWVHTLGMPFGQSGDARTVFGTFQDITERKRAEEDLRFQAQLLTTVGQAVIATNSDNQVTYWNRFAETLYGWSAQEAIGRNIVNLVPADTSREQAAEIIARLQTGETWSGEFTVRSKTGTTFPAMVTDTPILDDDGAQIGVIGVSMDITERKNMEAALEQERRLLRTMIDNIPDFIYVKDRDGRFLLRNTSWLNTMKVISPDEVIGKTDFDFYPHEMAERYTEDDQLVIRSGQPLINREETTLGPDGSTGWLLTTKVPLRDALGSVIGLVGIGHDITKRKQIEATLQEREQQLASIFDTVGDAIYYLTLEEADLFRFTSVNRAFLSVTGLQVDQVVGKAVDEVIPEPSLTLVREKYKTAIQTGEAVTWEETSDYPSGRLTGEVSIAPVYDSDGRCIHLVGTVHDITERKRAEAALQQYNVRLGLLHQIDRAILMNEVPQSIAEMIVQALTELIACDAIWIFAIDSPDNPFACLSAYPALSQTAQNQLRHAIENYGLPRDLRQGKGQLMGDIQTDDPLWPGLDGVLTGENARSWIITPVSAAGRLLGLIAVASVRPYAFTPKHFEITREVADQLAIALNNAELDQQIQEHARTLEARVTERTVELQAAKDRVEAILSNSPDGIVLLSSDLRLKQANPAFNRLFACESDDYFDQSLLALVLPQDHDRLLEIIQAVKANGQTRQCDVHARRKDATVFDASFNIGEVRGAGVIVAIRDISERKHLERQLRYHASLQKNVTDAVIATDLEFRIQSWNPAAERIYGWRAEEAIGKFATDILQTEYTSPEILDGILHGTSEDGSWSGEVVQHHKDGHAITTLSSVVLFKDDTRQPFGVVAISHDITMRKQAELALENALEREKELNELKSRFVSMASHEFRTPLASILANAETLSAYRSRLTEDQVEQKLNNISLQVGYLKNMMEDVLSLARLQARRAVFNPEPVDLDALFREIIDEFRGRQDVTHAIRYTCESIPPTAQMDPKLLRQLVSNLVSNAIKYSPHEKTIAVKLETIDEMTVFSVHDDGIGIAEDDLRYLFEPFHRGANVGNIHGTGLGLVIAKESVDLHGGTISVESQVGLGTTFTVHIPIAAHGG